MVTITLPQWEEGGLSSGWVRCCYGVKHVKRIYALTHRNNNVLTRLSSLNTSPSLSTLNIEVLPFIFKHCSSRCCSTRITELFNVRKKWLCEEQPNFRYAALCLCSPPPNTSTQKHLRETNHFQRGGEMFCWEARMNRSTGILIGPSPGTTGEMISASSKVFTGRLFPQYHKNTQ